MRAVVIAVSLLSLLPCIAIDSAAQPEPGNAMGVGEALAPAPFTLEQRFLEAARQGDRRTLEIALQRGVAVDAADELGQSALLLTAREAGSLEAMSFLRAKGAAIDTPDVGGRAAISWAAAAGRLELVRALASWGAKLDRGNEDGRTPLFFAALDDHRDVVAFLIDKGAQPDVVDRFGDTPLMMACAKGHGELAALLLRHGADPAHRNQEGRTARDRVAAGADVCLAPRPE